MQLRGIIYERVDAREETERNEMQREGVGGRARKRKRDTSLRRRMITRRAGFEERRMPCDRVRFSVKGFAYAVRRERREKSQLSSPQRRYLLRRERKTKKERERERTIEREFEIKVVVTER